MERIWWERVPNALNFVSAAVNHLLQEKSVVIQYGGALPWRDFFLCAVQNALQQNDCSKSVRSIPHTGEPGLFLLETFCPAEKRAAYRPSKSYAKFLAESSDVVLHGHYIFAAAETDDELRHWEDFISEYVRERGRGRERAGFMILYHGPRLLSLKRGVNCLSFDEAVTEYDRIVFATLAAASLGSAPLIRSYLTELAANLLGSDVELCAACVRRADDFLQDPCRLIQEIAAAQARSDGAPFCFDQPETEVSALIWRAQIRSIYPLLEEYRERFIERHYTELKRLLPIEAAPGEIYSEPEDLELGKLVYLAGAQKLSLKPEEYDRLEKYKNARNSLSHLSPLSYADIRALELGVR